jgi:hypothetical protein
VEDWVDLHRWRECEAVGDGGQFCGDFEGAITTGCEFRGQVMGLQVAAFKPHLFVFLKPDWNKTFF